MMFSFFHQLATFAAFNLGNCNPNGNSSRFFGFPHWWQYVPGGKLDGLGNCVPDVKFPGDIWLIALALVNILLYIGGIVAVGSILYSGFMYVTTLGNSEQATHAKNRIINSVIGLIIVVIASTVVSFLGNKLG